MRGRLLLGIVVAQQEYTVKVINLGTVRNLMTEWDKVRQKIAAGGVASWAVTLQDDLGDESIYLGGVYKEDPAAALKAALRLSAARVLTEDDPPKFGTGQ